MILDEEVFAVVIALTVIASALGIALTWRPQGEEFVAIGLLNEDCKIGYYPRNVTLGSNVTLCLYVGNYMSKPVAYKVLYKVALNASQLPTNTTPSSVGQLAAWVGALSSGSNSTTVVSVPIPSNASTVGSRVSLVFELWLLDTKAGSWVYSGRWADLWVQIVG
jgi:uncharacterized membrane protein